ncbi:MAG: hypothetical protein C0180_05200 [Aciduliprofundum sp.]|nr:MAG: hypothetical protein C0180_05200 [Aciduliprofundum sp.]
MRSSEYAINLTTMLFWLNYDKMEVNRVINQPMFTIYKHHYMRVSGNIRVVSHIFFKIIHRKVYKKVPAKAREHREPPYSLQILDLKNFSEPLIWLNMRGKFYQYEELLEINL